ncbi:hypothetical protein PQE71_gp171 [Bacillus phage Izhevsk]|uniref:Uncharacterized protein n=1 Tax=Bacillus phage Izhevsk TaxID=2724322 RepID=A0A6H0X6C7_9CAUD|nr:hypothetical protein PQE71_gp171 [Bacillus phage Izhevsk]QIW89853.1 hypothetical protein Izhevsk_172 [Bacillus phage Izhevsk]
MRWKSGKPKHRYQERHKTKFLWFPKKLEHEWRWLEKATYLQSVDVEYLAYGSGHKLVWCDVKWIDKEKKKKNI